MHFEEVSTSAQQLPSLCATSPTTFRQMSLDQRSIFALLGISCPKPNAPSASSAPPGSTGMLQAIRLPAVLVALTLTNPRRWLVCCVCPEHSVPLLHKSTVSAARRASSKCSQAEKAAGIARPASLMVVPRLRAQLVLSSVSSARLGSTRATAVRQDAWIALLENSVPLKV